MTKKLFVVKYTMLYGETAEYKQVYTHAESDAKAVSNMLYRLGKDKKRVRDVRAMELKKKEKGAVHSQLSFL